MDIEIDVLRTAPGALEALRQPGEYVARRSDLEPELLNLVRTYVSHLNGCRECVDRHAERARAVGEEPIRMQLLPHWREAPDGVFSERERSALAWTETVTRLGESSRASGALRAELRARFTERDLIDLTVAVISANGLDRLALALGTRPRPRRPAVRVRMETEGEPCPLCGVPQEGAEGPVV
ncbi:MAG TPA: carboxymuconolactone decarboxylase family protein [Longimicrobiaceae bacterium]|nr:carboxymuconolactone decarboxylase family protein [Longimicrobiaceae bacterium]